jgi:TP901 family phage tail tape measure protein
MASAVVGSLRAILSLDSADFEQSLVRTAKASDKLAKDWGTMGRQATALGKSLTATLTVPILGLGASAAKAAIDFESSFANVAKTVDGVADSAGVLTTEGKALALTFRQMAKEIPLTTDELNKIAALGGQMGVPISQMEKFTRNVAALGVAVDGISTEEAAIGLAQIGNIAGTGTTKIAEMASTLVHLGNSSNATEADILEFTKRLMGTGNSVGMTVPQVMALGTAMANVGINAEAGGTAMSTVITKISKAVSKGGDDLKAFANVAGKSADEFAAIWRKSPIEAIDLFVQGLSTMQGRGVDLNLTMGELGTEGIRVAQTLKSLAGAGDGVSRSLVTANEGYAAGNKHLEEAQKKYATTANQMKLLWNAVKDIGITLGNALLPALQSATKLAGSLIPVIDALARGFAAMPGSVQMVVLGLAGLAAAIGPVIWAVGSLMTAVSTITAAFGAKGIAMKLLRGEAGMLSTAMGFLGQAMAVVGVALAGWQIGRFIGEVTGATKAVQNWAESFWNLRDSSEPLESQQRTIAQAIKLGAAESVNFAQALQFLKDHAAKLRAEQQQGQAVTEQSTVSTRQASGASFDDAKSKQAQEKAAEAAKEAAEKLTQEIERQRQAVRALGLITKQDGVKAMEEFAITVERATSEGIPLERVLGAIRPQLVELINKARASGIAVNDMVDALAELDATVVSLRGGIPRLSTAIGALGSDAKVLARSFGMVTAEQMRAQTETALLSNAYADLGITTDRSLSQSAEAARVAYRRIAESGKATSAELQQARQAVLDAELAAGERTISLWESEILPAIQQAGQQIVGSLSNNFIDMLTGATSFKDGFVNIWEDLKQAVKNVLNTLLQTFLDEFLGGMLSGLMGWAGQAGKIFGSVFSMGSAGAGGMLSPSVLTAPGAGAGAGGATIGGVAAGAGLAVGAGAAGYTLGKMGWEFIGAAFGEHFTSPEAQAEIDYQELIRLAEYTGAAAQAGMTPEDFIASGGVPGFETGTNGKYVDFGAGTLAMLHGKEKITPMTGGTSEQATFVFEFDGQTFARMQAPYLVGEVRRLQLGR